MDILLGKIRAKRPHPSQEWAWSQGQRIVWVCTISARVSLWAFRQHYLPFQCLYLVKNKEAAVHREESLTGGSHCASSGSPANPSTGCSYQQIITAGGISRLTAPTKHSQSPEV